MSLSGNISFPEWLKKNQRQVQNSLRASTPLLRTLNGVNDHSLIKPSMDFICLEHSGRFKFASSLLALPLMPRLSQDRWGTVTGAMPISSGFLITNISSWLMITEEQANASDPGWLFSPLGKLLAHRTGCPHCCAPRVYCIIFEELCPRNHSKMLSLPEFTPKDDFALAVLIRRAVKIFRLEVSMLDWASFTVFFLNT